MASIYRLVAERRDRNQSLKRKRNTKNLNIFKDSIEEIQLRRPEINRAQSFRKRTASDQPTMPKSNKSQMQHDVESTGILKKTNDMFIVNVKNQLSDLNLKIDSLSKKIEDMSKIILPKNELNTAPINHA